MEASTEQPPQSDSDATDKHDQEEGRASADSDGSNGQNIGRIDEIQGVVLEVVFPDKLPEINNALTIKRVDQNVSEADRGEDDILVCEVQQDLGDNRVRAVAMDTTDGLARGMEVIDTGGAITVPVGEVTLGRIFNLLGAPIDLGEALPSAGASTRRPPGWRT